MIFALVSRKKKMMRFGIYLEEGFTLKTPRSYLVMMVGGHV